jgi:acetylornithine deacetylase/succinyl-diaminopimelate desuccinylase family protein
VTDRGAEHAALEALDDAATVNLLRRLVETPSTNPPGDEKAVAQLLSEALRDAGLETTLHEVMPGRPNVSARYGGDGGPTLLLNGHMDTMPPGPGWSRPPHEAVEVDGRLYGLGSCDMKAGLVAIVCAVSAVSRAGVPLNGSVLFDAVVDEEATGAGTKYTVAQGRSADYAVIAEPTELEVIRLGTGQVNFQVNFAGRAGHGSTPEAGHNAIYDAVEFVSRVAHESARLAADGYPWIGPPSYNIGRIDGGVRTSIIPSHCSVGVDRRIVPGQTVAQAIADLDRLIADTREARPGASVQRSVDIEYEPFELPEELPLCTVLRAAAAEVSGRDVSFGGMRGTTDAVFLTEAGTPTVVFGPGSIAQAHAPDEYVEVAQVHQATRALVLTITRLLTPIGEPRPRR